MERPAAQIAAEIAGMTDEAYKRMIGNILCDRILAGRMTPDEAKAEWQAELEELEHGNRFPSLPGEAAA